VSLEGSLDAPAAFSVAETPLQFHLVTSEGPVVADRGDRVQELGTKLVFVGSDGVIDPLPVSSLADQSSLPERSNVLGYVVLGYFQSVRKLAAAELLVARQQ
jgi:hypothetical protein